MLKMKTLCNAICDCVYTNLMDKINYETFGNLGEDGCLKCQRPRSPLQVAQIRKWIKKYNKKAQGA
jgi:hypothetical protein